MEAAHLRTVVGGSAPTRTPGSRGIRAGIEPGVRFAGPFGTVGALSDPRSQPRSHPGSIHRRVALLLAATVAVLVLGEGGARAAGPYLPEPIVYGDETTQAKVAQLDQLGTACTDVVLAGNSMGRDAFDPGPFTAADGEHRRAYNASLDAASPALLRRWLTEEVVPRTHPATVVVTLASLDLNAHGNATTSARLAYDSAPATATGPAGRLGAWFEAHSTLVRYRSELRDLGAVAAALGQMQAGSPLPRLSAAGITGLVGAAGQGESRLGLHYRHDASTKSFTRQQLLADFTIDDTQVADERALVTDLQAEGVAVVLVVLPVTADYVSLHPAGGVDFDRFLGVARQLAIDTGAPLIDLHDERGDEQRFADTHHLNAEGQAWFSATLPARLGAAGVLRPRRCP